MEVIGYSGLYRGICHTKDPCRGLLLVYIWVCEIIGPDYSELFEIEEWEC